MKIVQKYGGSSLADESCLRRVAKRVIADANGNQMLVVVSAQGKTTDALTQKYITLSQNIPSRESDALLITGEQASAALLAATLQAFGQDAVSLNGAQVPIRAKGSFGDGQIQWIGISRIREEWNRGRIVVVTGFQGVNRNGDFLTLGRGGSDTSAVALAAALKADRCMIFTDVDGVYSADPRKEDQAMRFSSIHSESMLNLSRAGAKVLHPRAAELALQYKVTLCVLSSFSQCEGTEISPKEPKQSGVTAKTDGETAEVTAVFASKPSLRCLSDLRDVCEDCDADFFYGGSIFCAVVPEREKDRVMKFFHKILCNP